MLDRCLHFIPGNRPELFGKIDGIGADGIVLDLEDAVPLSAKAEAVVFVHRWLQQYPGHKGIFVRVNGSMGPIAKEERELLARNPGVGCVLPKIESPEDLVREKNFFGFRSTAILALIESLPGLRNAEAVAATEGVVALGLGLEDLFSNMVTPNRNLGHLAIRLKTEIALAASAVGIGAIDTVSTDIEAGPEFEEEIAVAIGCGMTGKFSIHPRQVAPIQSAFGPSDGDIALARELDAAKLLVETGIGYLRRNREILSPPKLQKLRRIIAYLDHHDHHRS